MFKNLDIQSDLGYGQYLLKTAPPMAGNDEITADISSEYCTLNGDTLEIRLDIGAVADVYIPGQYDAGIGALGSGYRGNLCRND